MNNNNSRRYDTVQFPEYLDNGNIDIPVPPTLARLPLPKAHPEFHAVDDASQPSRDEKTTQPEGRPWFIPGYSRICSELLGVGVISADFPGGSHRSSCRLWLENGGSLIASRREAPGRALMEALILEQLFSHQAAVPEPYAFNGLVLLQQDLTGVRLSEVLENASDSVFEETLSAGLQSLVDIHQTAEAASLDQAVPVLGENPDWLIAFLDRTAVIGGFLNIPCPYIPVEAFYDLLMLLKPRFLKWDARPGNAMLNSDGKVVWFDWEHCCARNRLDDMAWLLCDESLPDTCPDAEERLIERFLPAFADGRPLDEAHAYLRIYGILHMCVRLGRILHAKGSGRWEDADRHLEKPYPGACYHGARRLCVRATRWSTKIEPTRILTDWFANISERLKEI